MVAVAIVLHAHLPYVGGEQPWSLAERWLHEAIFGCYLPLVEMLDRLADAQIDAPLSLSVSPTLASMLAHERLSRRFLQHLTALQTANQRALQAGSAPAEAARFYAERFDTSLRQWRAVDGDLLAAFRRHAEAARLELMTTSVTHALLPALATVPGAVEAQLRVGAESFAALSMTKLPRTCWWLPECAIDDRTEHILARTGCRYTVLDAHAIELAQPPPASLDEPILSTHGIACFARDRQCTRLVWSRRDGYPGHPSYREFHRDLGCDPAAADIVAPMPAGQPVGLKYFRITGRDDKRPYLPQPAQDQVDRDADDFVAQLHRRAANISRGGVIVAAYDAELFGHWWLEGPAFLEGVLRRIAASERLQLCTLENYLNDCVTLPAAQPAASSWGAGGFGRPWLGPRTAHLWRGIHRCHRAVSAALQSSNPLSGPRGDALDQAIRELLLLEASDWLFMIDGGDMAEYGRHRLQDHARRVDELLDLARSTEPSAQRLDLLCPAGGFLRELSSERLREAFCPSGG